MLHQIQLLFGHMVDFTDLLIGNEYNISASVLTVPLLVQIPDSKLHGANMGPTWVLSVPDGPHGGPMNLAIMDTCLPPDGLQAII